MSTIDSKKIIDDIVAGRYADDKPTRIVQYINAFGNTTWGVTFKGEDINRYLHETNYVRRPFIYWQATTGLTGE